MKKAVAFVTALVLLVTLVTPAFSVAEEDGTGPAFEERNLSGQYYDEIFGDGGAYQVVSVAPAEGNDGFLVAYVAERDTSLRIAAVDEDSGKTIAAATLPAPAGSGSIVFPAPLERFPRFYRVEAALLGGGETFTWYAHTRAYREFLSASPGDANFAGRVVLDYGEGFDGAQNFAVVSEDVKVIRVDALDDDSAALFSLGDGPDDAEYRFSGAEIAGALDDLNPGDKALILPRDDVNDTRTLIVGGVERSAVLLDGESVPEVTLTPANVETRLEDFFDFVRIHVEVEATEQDIDAADADPDVEEIIDDDPRLMGSYGKTFSQSRKFSFKRNFDGLRLTDTFSLSARIRVSVEYSLLSLKGVTAVATLEAKNDFSVRTESRVSSQNQWLLGTIPVGNISGVNISIPVYVTFYASIGASMNINATQSSGASVTATYSGGKYGCTTSAWAKVSKSFSIKGSTTVRMGVKADVQANVLFVPLYIGVTGEVGAEVKGSMQNARTFSGELNIYVHPSLFVKWQKKYLVKKTWPISRTRVSSLDSSHEAYYSIGDMLSYSDEEITQLLKDYEDEGLAVTMETADDLRALSQYVNAGKPTRDILFLINLPEGGIDLGGEAWTPVGTELFPFRGEFDGKGVTVSGLTVSGESDCAGLFGAVCHASVYDVTLSGVSVSGGNRVGGLVGYASDDSQIYDIAVSGDVRGTGGQVGGIVGRLETSSLLNSYSAASVSGGDAVGGVAGTFTFHSTAGQLANCYSVGAVTSEATRGGVCGRVEQVSDAQAAEELARQYPILGARDCYCLSADNLPAVGDGDAPELWAVTDEQAKGLSADAIAPEGYASASSLLDALNGWYADYGALLLDGEKADSDGIPEGNSSDYYNRWYANAGNYPSFAAREKTYPLTVYYVYEDGSEARPSVTLYYRLGEAFDVDPYHLDGYATNVDADGYQGYMNPDPTQAEYEWADADKETFTGLEFRIIYTPVTRYDGNGASLPGGAAKSGEVYKIETQADLEGLAAYVNAGGDTRGVAFEQVAEIAVSGTLDSIGSTASPFRGSYHGNYLSVTGLSAPFFGATDGANVEALSLTANIAAYSGNVGAAAGDAKDSAFSDCRVTLTADASGDYAAGLIGYAENCEIDFCSAEGDVKGASVAGGLVGGLTGGSVRNSASAVNVEGANDVGGFAGRLNSGAVENCYASGAVKGSENAGGFAGNVVGGRTRNVYAAGTVDGNANAGAAFGTVSDAATVESAYCPADAGLPAVGMGDAAVSAFADADALTDKLNDWVAAATSAAYRVWVPDEASMPVLGDAFSGWLTDFALFNHQVMYHFDREKLGDGSVYIVVYSDAGRMLSSVEITEPGEGAVAVDASAAYAKCFVFDDEFCPLADPIRTAS